jgi:hypothetical protein
MLKRKKYKVYPTLLSNTGNNTDNIWLSGPLELNDNDDVQITDPQDGDVLVYDEENGIWINSQLSDDPAIDINTESTTVWLSEFHSVGNSEVPPYLFTTLEEYYGHANGPYTFWGEKHYDSQFDILNYNFVYESAAGRPIPIEGATKLFFSGSVTMIPGYLTEIRVYYVPCQGNEGSFPLTILPTCLGEYNTSVFPDPAPEPGVACVQFEIDFLNTLGQSPNVGDYILISFACNSPGTFSPTEIFLSDPFIVNFSLGLQTNGDLTTLNSVPPCDSLTE